MLGQAHVCCGGLHTVALTVDGNVICWGHRRFGQWSAPSTLRNVIAISAGARHVAALDRDKTVTCWGYNFFEQTFARSFLGNFIAVRCGPYVTCALTEEGRLVCWGSKDCDICNVPDIPVMTYGTILL
jgi:alpha-tubulin suppressor-like RCC1 family protein